MNRILLFAATVLAGLLIVTAGAGSSTRGGHAPIPIYLEIPGQYASAVTPDQMAQTITHVFGQPSDAPCIGSRACSIEAWFRHELGQVFDYTIITVAAPNQSNAPPNPVDACGRFSSPGLYLGAEQALTDAGIRPPSRYFMVMMGAGGWAGHFSPADKQADMGLVGDWGGEVYFGTTAQDPCNWTTEPAGGMSHEFAGMLGMYVTDGYTGALWTGDVMTANNKRDLLRYSGKVLYTP